MGRVKGNQQGVVKTLDPSHCRDPVTFPGTEREASKGGGSRNPERGTEVVGESGEAHLSGMLTSGKEVNLS